MCQNGVHAKETEADIAELVFSKGQHELKTLIVPEFFESAFEDLSFHSFQKPVIEILRKRTVVINIEYGLIVIKAQILSGER